MNSKRSIFSSIVIIVCLAIVSLSCGKKSAIHPLFDNIDIEYNTFKVDVNEGAEIKLESGTTIKIPKSIFVDNNNNSVEGEVEIKYREFHDAIDVMIAGIPLTYDSAGITMDFVTAGMFEIYGFKDDKPIFIKEGEQITVDLASYVGDGGYNAYKWNDSENNWEYRGDSPADENEGYTDALAELPPEPTKPVEIKKLDKKSFLMDFDVDYSDFPELRSFNGIMWEYAGDGSTDDPKKNSWIFSEDWTSIKLKQNQEKEGIYIMMLNNSEKTFQTDIRPVLTGLKYKNAQKEFEKKMQEYEEIKEIIKKKKEALKRIAGFVRSLQVNQFGIFNPNNIICMRFADINHFQTFRLRLV